MADLTLPSGDYYKPSTVELLPDQLGYSLEAEDGSEQTMSEPGTRYKALFSYRETRNSEVYDTLKAIVKRLFVIPTDRLVLDLEGVYAIPSQSDVTITVTSDTNANATELPITSNGNLPIYSYVQIGRTVNQTIAGINSRSTTLKLLFPLRKSVKANATLSTHPKMYLKSHGALPPMEPLGYSRDIGRYGALFFTLREE